MSTVFYIQPIDDEIIDVVPSLSKRQKLVSKVKTTTKTYTTKVSDYIKKPETKIAALISYWAVEAVISAFAVYAFIMLHMYGSAFAMLFLLAYLSYATFGVVGEAVKA